MPTTTHATPPEEDARSPRASPVRTRAHTGVVSDDAMAAATGHPRTHWFELLDAQTATTWRHRDIATWLVEAHGVDAWWAQGITVGYEQARGIRVPGQRQDGSFESSTSKTLPVEVPDAYRLVADDAVRDRWLGMPVQVTGETVDSSVRWQLADGSRVVVRVQAVRPGATRVVVQHARLADSDAVTESKALWSQRLSLMAKLSTTD